MKKVLLGLVVGMSLSTAAAGASPLEDYSLGRAEINVGTAVIPAMAVTTALEGMGSSTDKTDARNRIEGGATVGLGHNLALQFKYVDSQRKPGDAEYNMRTQEYNLRCKLDKNVSVYVGELHARFAMKYAGKESSASRNMLQAGVQYEAKLGKNLTGWAGMGFGSNLQHYELGLGYALTKNLDLDLSYQYTQVKDFTQNLAGAGDEFRRDVTAKGLYAGLSYKF